MSDDSRENFEIVKVLTDSTQSKNALLLVPYAGGAAEAYAVFTEKFKAMTDDYFLYFVPYLHNETDFVKAAEEIMEIAKTKTVSIYSHCAGAGVAMKLINLLEEKKDGIVKCFIYGGFIPPEKPKKENFWNTVNDEMLKSVLVNAGAAFLDLPDETVKEILVKFREDTNFMTKYYYEDVKILKCPVYSVIIKTDFFTQNFDDAERLWKYYCENFNAVEFIETDTHYFQSHDSEKLLEILCQNLH